VPWFSERYGYSKGRDSIQVDDIDVPTRKRIWNLICEFYTRSSYKGSTPDDQMFLEDLWDRFFKETLDHLKSLKKGQIYGAARKHVLSHPWKDVYDFIEATLTFHRDESMVERFTEKCNQVLEEEKSGYRIIGGYVTSIISPMEIAEVDAALESPFTPINAHLEKSLSLMSDRTAPDYPNSIKESISAVECVCQIIVGKRGVVLNRALSRLEAAGVEINDELKKGFRKLYGWTSSDDGIRHAMMDLPTVDHDDARYMLVTCSAFVNYLISEANKAAIDLNANFIEMKNS